MEQVGEAIEDGGSSPETSEDEGEEIGQPLLVKKKAASTRILDSDEEEDEAPESEGDDEVAPLNEDRDVGVAEGVCLVEGSMPPLRLDSVEDEDSLLPASQTSLAHLNATNSGLGRSLLQQHGSLSEEEDEKEEEPGKCGQGNEDEGSMSAITDGDSLELSFQWGQSLPLAQRCTSEWDGRRKKPVLHRDDTINIWEEESQWQATPATNVTQSQFLSQGLDDETQFLDEDG